MIRQLLTYFLPFENEYGLLENLDGWVFVEWSKANDLIKDVNYPTNMLYAAALKNAGELYGEPVWCQKAAHLAQTIQEWSFDGRFFTDNEVRTEQGLRPTGEQSETCQYYAFFFDIATPQSHPTLWQALTEQFGPDRDQSGLYPSVYPANAFIGQYLRLEILTRYGQKERFLKELESYFYHMAEETGTLWENRDNGASCNHGFASYAACLIERNS